MEALSISQDMQQQVLRLMDALANEESETGGSEESQKRLLLASIVALRAANRNAWLSSRSAKQKTNETKQAIDRMNLELQGLFYEQRHLRSEIQICKATP
jgi:THO complex subunit 5